MRSSRFWLTAAQTVPKNSTNSTARLFPHNQPVPPYAISGANNEQRALTGGPEHNAGATGLNGSGGQGFAWTGQAYRSQR